MTVPGQVQDKLYTGQMLDKIVTDSGQGQDKVRICRPESVQPTVSKEHPNLKSMDFVSNVSPISGDYLELILGFR